MVKLSEPLRCHALYDVKTTVLLVIYTTEPASPLFLFIYLFYLNNIYLYIFYINFIYTIF